MKNFFKFLALGVVLAVSTISAHATPINGTLNISGTVFMDTGTVSPVPFTPTTVTLSFSGTPSNAGTGIFAGGGSAFGGPSQVSFTPTFSYAFTNPTSCTPVNCVLFTVTDAQDTYTFTVTGALFLPGDVSPSSIYFYGLVSGSTLVSPVAASYEITPTSSMSTGAYSSTLSVPPVAPTPEPNSLMLLGTGLASAAGVIFRRRRA